MAHSKDRQMEKKPMYHFTLDTQVGSCACARPSIRSGRVMCLRRSTAIVWRVQKATAQAWGGGTAHPAAETSGEVRLAMTEEHLQALLAKLREACRVVEAPQS